MIARELISLKENIGTLKADVSTRLHITSFASVALSFPFRPPVTSTSSQSMSKGKITALPTPAVSDVRSSITTLTGPVQVNHHSVLESPEDNNEFQPAVPQRNRRKRNRPTVIGTKKCDSLYDSRPRLDMFIIRVSKEYSDNDLRRILTDENIGVIELKKVSHDLAATLSYKLTIYADSEVKLMQPSFWPEYISCRRFFTPRKLPINFPTPRLAHHESNVVNLPPLGNTLYPALHD